MITLQNLSRNSFLVLICTLLLQGHQAHSIDSSIQHPASFGQPVSQLGRNASSNPLSWSAFISKMPAPSSLDLQNKAVLAGKAALSKAPTIDTSSWPVYLQPRNVLLAAGLAAIVLPFLNGQKNLFLIQRRYQNLNAKLGELITLETPTSGGRISTAHTEAKKLFNLEIIELARELNNGEGSPWPLVLVVTDLNKSIKELNGWMPATFGLIKQAVSNKFTLPNFLSQSFYDLKNKLTALRRRVEGLPDYNTQRSAFDKDQEDKQQKAARMLDEQRDKQEEKQHQAKLRAAQIEAAKRGGDSVKK